jgi:hypothetical protein
MPGSAPKPARRPSPPPATSFVHEVTDGFYGVLQAQAFADVQAQAIASIEESLRIAASASPPAGRSKPTS